MDFKLHANAITTPRTRAYIQNSQASNAALARELGIHSRTVARWKARREIVDRSTRPHRLTTALTEWEEGLIVELRRSLALPLDDIVEAMRRCINPELSRSAIYRCLQRHSIPARLTRQKAAAAAFHTDAPAGLIHLDVKYLTPLDRRRRYACVAIDRATRFVYLEILPDRRALTAAGFLDRFPLTVHTRADRQRFRVHRPLCRRQKGQAARPAGHRRGVGQQPLRHPAAAQGHILDQSRRQSAVIAAVRRIDCEDEPLLVATCTFHAGAVAPSASRITRASGALTDTLGSPFFASTLACLLARSARSCANSAGFCCARLTRCARSSAACRARFRRRRSGSAGSCSSSLFSAATRSATAFLIFCSRWRWLSEPRPAPARTLVPSIANSSSVISCSAIRPVRLCVSKPSKRAPLSRRNAANRS